MLNKNNLREKIFLCASCFRNPVAGKPHVQYISLMQPQKEQLVKIEEEETALKIFADPNLRLK